MRFRSLYKSLAEARVAFEFGATLAGLLAIVQELPRGRGKVLVLPGFMTGDWATVLLRRALAFLGYDVYGWELGLNNGQCTNLFYRQLIHRLEEVAKGEKVAVIGWSLGGAYARWLAHEKPELVSQVITLGSPFAGDFSRIKKEVRELFEKMAGSKLEDLDCRLLETIKKTPLVPTCSIFSRTDAVVHYTCSLENETVTSENVEIECSHCGLPFYSEVIRVLANRLAQPIGNWQRHDAVPVALQNLAN